jgi:methylenetetrahydrofolate dehydrogenase (NADP+)/methenyltetrahydrofolate cyclohydrolase
MTSQAECTLLDGKSLAKSTLEQLKLQVDTMPVKPKLAVIVAGQDAPSLSYVKMKRKWAAQIGAESEAYFVNENTTQVELFELVHRLNEDHGVHGILVQHPLPSFIDESQILSTVKVSKDVDGISPLSVGLLASRMKGHRAATPLGIIRLLDNYNIPLRGANVVVVGCSIILGRPMALMMIERDATVSITHKYTKNMPELLANADIVISATGVPGLIRGADLKDGVVAVDCGYAIVNDVAVGDIRYDEVFPKASYITPVPGGVGPMTVATLLSNLIDAYWEQA